MIEQPSFASDLKRDAAGAFVFINDPIYAEAMRLGREYRESLRPKVARKPARKAGKKSAKKRGR